MVNYIPAQGQEGSLIRKFQENPEIAAELLQNLDAILSRWHPTNQTDVALFVRAAMTMDKIVPETSSKFYTTTNQKGKTSC